MVADCVRIAEKCVVTTAHSEVRFYSQDCTRTAWIVTNHQKYNSELTTQAICFLTWIQGAADSLRWFFPAGVLAICAAHVVILLKAHCVDVPMRSTLQVQCVGPRGVLCREIRCEDRHDGHSGSIRANAHFAGKISEEMGWRVHN